MLMFHTADRARSVCLFIYLSINLSTRCISINLLISFYLPYIIQRQPNLPLRSDINMSCTGSACINILVCFFLFLKSLDYNIGTCLTLSESTTIFCRLLRSLLSSRSLRACFSRHTFFPGTTEKILGKKKKSILFFQRLGRLSFAFISPAS